MVLKSITTLPRPLTHALKYVLFMRRCIYEQGLIILIQLRVTQVTLARKATAGYPIVISRQRRHSCERFTVIFSKCAWKISQYYNLQSHLSDNVSAVPIHPFHPSARHRRILLKATRSCVHEAKQPPHGSDKYPII